MPLCLPSPSENSKRHGYSAFTGFCGIALSVSFSPIFGMRSKLTFTRETTQSAPFAASDDQSMPSASLA